MQQIKITQSVTARTMAVDAYLKDISTKPMISPEEETELADRIKAGDEEAYRRLVEANLRFVVSVAKQYQSSGMDLADLINEGNVGLMIAARRFDPSRGFKFISYAVWWIRQSILQALSEHGRMVRLPLNQVGVINRINRTKATFLQENQREPTNAELAELMDLTPEKIAAADSLSARHLSFDTPFDDEGEGTLLDIIPDTGSFQADDSMRNDSLGKDLSAVLSVLPERDREIVKLSYGIGCREMTPEEIGTRFNLSRERVRQVREKAIRRLSAPKTRARLIQYR